MKISGTEVTQPVAILELLDDLKPKGECDDCLSNDLDIKPSLTFLLRSWSSPTKYVMMVALNLVSCIAYVPLQE